MKILQINLEKGWRGGERQTFLTACAQRDLGHTVELVARPRAELANKALKEGFTVHYAHNAMSLALWLGFHGSQFDVLHAQTAGSVTGAVLAKALHRRPIVFSRRTDFPVSSWSYLTKLKWKHIDQIVAISQSAASDPRKFGIKPIIIPSATTTDNHAPERVRDFIVTHALAGKHLIGTSAVLNPDKDPLTLIRAAAHVCQNNPNVVFVHWGAQGSCSADARALIAKLGLEHKYLLLGFQKNPEQLYPALSAFLLCSTFEALGSSLLDAMSLGIPVIGTETGGIKEVLAEGRGLLAPVGNAQAIAHHIEWVLKHPEQVRDMTTRAAEYVRTEHDVNVMAKRYLALYSQLCRE